MNRYSKESYQKVIDSIDGFIERSPQKKLISTIDDLFDSKEHCVGLYNAPTGSGKTLGYLIASLSNSKKPVVICTATVNLQEQILNKDLPCFIKAVNPSIQYAIAKGRGRYLCMNSFIGKHEFLVGKFGKEMELIETQIQNGWEGDLDSLSIGLKDEFKKQVNCQNIKCKGSNCPYADDCSFYKDRRQVRNADIIITNYSLLLADLKKEDRDQRQLPEPNEATWVMDEGDALPSVLEGAYKGFLNPGIFLKSIKALIKTLSSAKHKNSALSSILKKLNSSSEVFSKIEEYLVSNLERFKDAGGLRFQRGVVPPTIKEVASRIEKQLVELTKTVNALDAWEDEVQKDAKHSYVFDTSVLGNLKELIESSYNAMLGLQMNYKDEAYAKYAELDSDWELVATPLEPGRRFFSTFFDQLGDSKCIITSGTLKVAGSFDYIVNRLGLAGYNKVSLHSFSSCFNYKDNLLFEKLTTKASPKDYEGFTRELINELPKRLCAGRASLVLFSSYRQMNDVYESMPIHIKQVVIKQGDQPRDAIINEHKKRVDNGEWSIIFGVKSFAVGVDLPGGYCEHVVITKLDFAPPISFLEQAHHEFIALQGRDPFYERAVPEATKILQQSIGRGNRTEKDHAVVTFCDKRLWTTQYGRYMQTGFPEGRWLS